MASLAAPAARTGQTAVGLALAGAIFAGWAALHVYGVFVHRLTPVGAAVAPLMIAVQTWLNVGLFIVAHDCMHGTLAPGRPAVNRWVGRVALGVYAGFSYDRLLPKHFDHHKHPGTEHDPDFSATHPTRFWPWFLQFFRTYFGWREFAVLAVLLWSYVLLLGASPVNALLFWGVPAILSSLQLFLFGTWLPHRHADGFADDHRARSNDYPAWASLLTCFHFGYHHEHHRAPHLPWWRLPSERKRAPARPDRPRA